MKDKAHELVYPGKAPEGEVLATHPAILRPMRTFHAREGGGAGGGWTNMLVRGDNLGVLKALVEMKGAGGAGGAGGPGVLTNSDGTPGVRLVYIDPPFGTNLKYRGKGDQRAFEDLVTGAEFIEFLRRRLILIRELLCPGGSVFVHLDWKMAHYVRVIMDEVFGAGNFLNEIIWHYGGRGAKAVSGQFSRNHDIIFWYGRPGGGGGGPPLFNRIYRERRVAKGEGGFRRDDQGRWFKTAPRGDYTDESVEALEREGRIHRTRSGKVRIKYFLREEGAHLIEDRLVGDVWDDIPDAMHLPRAEKTGYPTQKPERLLVRIIEAASAPGDVVLDAFCGAGTTLVASEKLGRRWIGVDSGRLAVETTEGRLLGLEGSGDPASPRKRYRKPAAPFVVYYAKGR